MKLYIYIVFDGEDGTTGYWFIDDAFSNEYHSKLSWFGTGKQSY